MSRVSVVIPVYSLEKDFLTAAFDSILTQTLTDWEMIVVCEYGSNIETMEVLEQYQLRDTRIRILYNDKRLGISASLNRGITASTGEYIARMDGDDIAVPERLQKQVSFLDIHKEIGICGTDVTFINEHGKKIHAWDGFPTEYEQIKSDLLFYCCLRHPTVMMRRDLLLLNNLQYNEVFKATEDFEFWSRASVKIPFANLREKLLYYRWFSGNATHQKNNEGVKNYIDVMDFQYRRLGIVFTQNQLEQLCPLTCFITWRNQREVRKSIENSVNLILQKNQILEIYDNHALLKTLSKRLYWQKKPFCFIIAITLRSVSEKWNKKKLMSIANYIEWNGLWRTFRRSLSFLITLQKNIKSQ